MGQTLHALLRDTGVEIPADLVNPEVTTITSDSRSVGPGCLFLGLPGERVDGGSFWRQALNAGAAAAVIGPKAASAQPPSSGDPVVVVSEPVARKVGELSAAFWEQPSRRMVGTALKTALKRETGCQT